VTRLDELYAQHDAMLSTIARVQPELDALKMAIGPWLRDVASGRPSTEPVEMRKRYAELQAERWTCRNFEDVRREIGKAESHSLRMQEQIAMYDAEIARLDALPESTPSMTVRTKEEITWMRRYRDSYQITLDLIGIPRTSVEVSA
jgi:hypothetical protein